MRVFSPRTLVLATVVLFGPDAAVAAMPQSDEPLTGQALPCKQGKIKDFECKNVELLAYLPADRLGQSVGADLWGWHDSTTGREFLAIGGASTAFVEVTDPVNPKYLGVLPPHEGMSSHAAQSVKVYKHYALIGYEGIDH